MNNRWELLDLNSKSELMKLYLKNGITSLSDMKEHYNSYQGGGGLKKVITNTINKIQEPIQESKNKLDSAYSLLSKTPIKIPIVKYKAPNTQSSEYVVNMSSNNVYNNWFNNNGERFNSFLNTVDYPEFSWSNLYNEGYLSNMSGKWIHDKHNTSYSFNPDSLMRNSNASTDYNITNNFKDVGNFGLDNISKEELIEAGLQNRVKDLVRHKPFDGKEGTTVLYLTPKEAVKIYDVKAKGIMKTLKGTFGEDSINTYFKNNTDKLTPVLRVLYRMPNKISVSKAKTIDDFIDYIYNNGGKNASISQAEEALQYLQRK